VSGIVELDVSHLSYKLSHFLLPFFFITFRSLKQNLFYILFSFFPVNKNVRSLRVSKTRVVAFLQMDKVFKFQLAYVCVMSLLLLLLFSPFFHSEVTETLQKNVFLITFSLKVVFTFID
jgi:hypothetical protein